MAILKLPRLKANLAIVDGKGRPTDFFLRLFNIDFAGRLERTINDQSEIVDQLVVIVNQLQAVALAAQNAQAAANEAQTSADGAAGGTARSGSTSDNFAVTGTAWVLGSTVVSLPTVVAGNLTIFGSGPIQTSTVYLTGGNSLIGQWRVVEIDGGVETTVFTGSFRAISQGGMTPNILNESSDAVAAFSDPRTSTGTIGYRLDVARISGASLIGDLGTYLYVRRE